MGEAGFSQLLDAIYCPICGGRLRIEVLVVAGGKRRLVCDRHGEMRVYSEVKP